MTIDVSLPEGRSYSVHFGSLSVVPELMTGAGLAPGLCLIVTDSNVGPLHLGELSRALKDEGWRPHARVLPAGEESKSLDQLGALYDWALAMPGNEVLTRTTPVVALGGGVVGDVAGFAAATLLRGLPLVQIPTSLLAQVDSSVGGKTSINHAAGKNLIGAFHQPRLVVVDAATLGTLPTREWHSGMAEVVKAALLDGGELLHLLESGWADLPRDPVATKEMLRCAISIKAGIVEEDEQEAGLRAVLNLGHTFAHAIEAATGYGTITHGEAVAIGLRAALYLSLSLYPELEGKRADALVARIPISPTHLPPTGELMRAMSSDKKRSAEALRFVLLEQVGRPVVREEVPTELVERAWGFARGVALRGFR